MKKPAAALRGSGFAMAVVAALLATAAVSFSAQAQTREPIPDGATARATSGDIIEATLIGKTTRYKHFVLGSQHEAAGMRVKTAQGQTYELMLPQDSVFEDRQPRIADLDGDGRNEVITIRSRQSVGSSLAVLGLRDGKLAVIAESTPNGSANRWLNPSSTGDFLGNGKKQVALVRMPHVVGRLEFMAFDSKALHLRGALAGTSNHRIGTRALNLSAVIPRAAPHGDLLAIPSLDRRTLRIVAALPAPREIAAYQLNGEVGGDITARESGDGFTVIVPLRGGGTQDIAIGRDILSRQGALAR